VKLLSWNVNGIRSVLGKGFAKFLALEDPDVLCLQETRTASVHVPGPWDGAWHAHWSHATKKGYAGTAVFTREEPLSIVDGIGRRTHGAEGRSITCEFPDFYLVNLYVPNAQRELTRLGYRMEWDRDLRTYLRKLDRVKPVLVCGDFNVAHEEIDLARPKDNRGNSGFTDEERANFTKLLKAGFIDTFRTFETGPGHYSWWTFRAGARKKNVGWRIDYWLASERLRPAIKRAFILASVTGSDHCPVGIELDLS
jgi:exodeoxyribonuclease-3